MSKEALAAFLRQLAIDQQLREELVAAASKRGLLFSPDELGKVDFEQACTTLNDAVDATDDDDTAQGSGSIEVPE
jgi:hypothetical protein